MEEKEPKITFFGSTKIVQSDISTEPDKKPPVCFLCNNISKQYVMFGGKSIGACCFPKIEGGIVRRMPTILEWIIKITESQQRYIEFRTKILNDLIDALGGKGITFEAKPTNQMLGFHMVDECLGNDLFDSGSGSGYCNDEFPTIKCDWCGKTQHYNGNDSILYTNFAGCQILTCCWPDIEKSTFHLLPQIVPSFITHLQKHADQANYPKYWLDDIKKIVNKNN